MVAMSTGMGSASSLSVEPLPTTSKSFSTSHLVTSTIDLRDKQDHLLDMDNVGIRAEPLAVSENNVDRNLDSPDGLEPKVPAQNPMGIDCAIKGSYQGQEKDLLFFSSTASTYSESKFVTNPNWVRRAFTQIDKLMLALVCLADHVRFLRI
ncbi:hypothetical protein N8I77_005874 [Diaporthe amygdali]|uniref:Uncharacterized protein n=1 Tax=Phomopsis amygdali TaxID=1214568 RepID=A0AAD9SGL3_PHOAM|nr:hypothetical protein N8I77_005874 [Diaporthe amygdali]